MRNNFAKSYGILERCKMAVKFSEPKRSRGEDVGLVLIGYRISMHTPPPTFSISTEKLQPKPTADKARALSGHPNKHLNQPQGTGRSLCAPPLTTRGQHRRRRRGRPSGERQRRRYFRPYPPQASPKRRIPGCVNAAGGFAYANEQLKDNKGNGWKMSRRGRLLFC